jgi:hypothetical protein
MQTYICNLKQGFRTQISSGVSRPAQTLQLRGTEVCFNMIKKLAFGIFANFEQRQGPHIQGSGLHVARAMRSDQTEPIFRSRPS